MEGKYSLVPENIEAVKAYVPGKTIKEVVEAYQPERISKLASNENRFGYSARVEPAVQQALKTVNNYPDPIARDLTAALARKLGRSPEEIIIGAGSESLLAGLCRTFFLEGQHLLTADATFVGVFIQAKVHGVEVKKVPLNGEYRFDVQAIAAAVNNATKMVYIANPNNPTGTYITRSEFEWLMRQIPEHVLVVMDEAYYEFTEGIEDYPDVLNYKYDNVIVLRTFSKGYGLAGFRVGYAIAKPQIINYLRKTRLTFEPGTVAQAAALAALEDTEFLQNTIIKTHRAKQELYTFFAEHEISYTPSIANFVMIDLKSEEKAKELTQKCMEQGVILRHIAGFGLPNCIRITVGQSDEIQHFKKGFLSGL